MTTPDTATLQFAVRALDPGQSGESVVAEAGQGRIAVRATLSAPDPCRALSGELDRSGQHLTLRVSVRPNDAHACVQVIGRFGYDAAIEGLAPGRYRLQVVHTYPATGWPTRAVLDETFDVR
jgi:hypothetical protein